MRKVNLDKNDLVSFSSQLDVLEACGYKMERKGNFVKSIIINDEIIKMPLIGYINDLYKEEINKNRGNYRSEIEVAEYLLNKEEIDAKKREEKQKEIQDYIKSLDNIDYVEIHLKKHH